MRIISGSCKGRKLYSPEGTQIRPTGDKVKGAVFSMLGEHVENAIVLDLFAGTGNLGLEALSRGARKCYFCDIAPESIRLLKKNIDLCNVAIKSEIIIGSFERALGRIKDKLDLIFLDPPHDKDLFILGLEAIRNAESLRQDGIVVVEYQADSKLPEDIRGFTRLRERHYGRTRIALLASND